MTDTEASCTHVDGLDFQLPERFQVQFLQPGQKPLQRVLESSIGVVKKNNRCCQRRTKRVEFESLRSSNRILLDVINWTCAFYLVTMIA